MKKRTGFQHIAKDLEEDTFERELDRRKGNYKKWILAAGTFLFVMLLFWGIQLYRNRDWTYKELKDYTQSLILDYDADFQFNWTVDKLRALKYDEKGDKGEKLSKVLRTYGQPSDVEIISEQADLDAFTLIYTSNSIESKDPILPKRIDYEIPFQEVRLSFKKINGTFRLFEKVGEMRHPDYPEDESYQFNWTEQDFMDLKEGVLYEDNLSMAKDVYEKFGAPN